MKIYDCTIFLDEKMMYDLRLNLLNEHVYKFVVVESLYTHAGNKKKAIFNIDDYKKFKDKIIYILLDKEPEDIVKVKEIRVRPRIDTHDLETKVNLGRKFISDGCKLKVTLMYRGRELSRTDLGLAVLERVIEMLSDIAEVEKEGDLEGRRQTIVLTGK